MTNIILRNTSGMPLHCGQHESVVQAVEFCIQHAIPLDGIDLRGEMLCCANWDGWSVKNAILTGANLAGANLSETVFRNCDFSGCDLSDACFCYADLLSCSFCSARFHATDISQARLDCSSFSGSPAPLLNFSSAYSLTGVRFISPTRPFPDEGHPYIGHHVTHKPEHMCPPGEPSQTDIYHQG